MRYKRWVVGGGLVALVIVIALIFRPFSHQEESSEFEDTNTSLAQNMVAEAPLVHDDVQKASYSTSASGSVNSQGATQTLSHMPHKIIFTAEIDLIVDKLDSAKEELLKRVRARGGYVSGMNVGGSSGSPREGTWSIRVPVSQYNGFLDDLSRLGEVRSLNATSKDVGEEYYDTAARVTAKRVEEQRLLSHLQRSTAKLSDILAVERELSRVRTEIETMEGRLRYLTNQTDLTTITVQIHEARSFVPGKQITFGTQVSLAWASSLRTMRNVGKSVTLVAVALLPWGIVMGLLGAPLWPVARRWGARRRPSPSEAVS